MPDFAVECEDGRVFQVEAATPAEAVAAVARQRNLRPSALRAAPVPRRQREWAMPLFWGIVGLLGAAVFVMMLT